MLTQFIYFAKMIATFALLFGCVSTNQEASGLMAAPPNLGKDPLTIDIEYAYQLETCAKNTGLVYNCRTSDFFEVLRLQVSQEQVASKLARTGLYNSEHGYNFTEK